MTFREKIIAAALVVGILATLPIWMVVAPLILENERTWKRAGQRSGSH